MKKSSLIILLTFLIISVLLVTGCDSDPGVVPDEEPDEESHEEAVDFPTEAIRLYINFAAGGTTDMSGRLIADRVQEHLGVNVIVENKPGGGGSLGPTLVAHSGDSGHTVGTLTASPVTTLPYMEDLQYDVETDLIYLVQYATTHHPIAVRADAPWDTLDDVIEYARANPGQWSFGTAGALNSPHIAMEQWIAAEDLDVQFIPFSEGGAVAMAQLMGGHIDATVVSDFSGPLEAGEIKLLAETGDAPIIGREEVPTFIDLGYDFSSVALVGLILAADTPPEIVAILEEAFTKVIEDPVFQQQLIDLDMTPTYKNRQEFTEYVINSYRNTGQVLEMLDF